MLAAAKLHLDQGMRDVLSMPKRELTMTIPVPRASDALAPVAALSIEGTATLAISRRCGSVHGQG